MSRKRRLAVHVSESDVRVMTQNPFPTYLIAVDEPAETAYIVSIHGNLRGPIHSVPAFYELNEDNLRRLHEEVQRNWSRIDASAKDSVFTI